MNSTDEVVEELRDALAPELLLLDRLGSGGMGDVFLARDPVLKRTVAVKVLASRLGLSAQARQRFAREAESAAAVAHPNVVPIYRVGHLPRSELGYIVMAYVEGPTLRELVPEGKVASESEVRRIMAEVAGALAAAHARGVVHRDIKPANVLYDQLSGRFVVVDFGIASVLDRNTDGARVRLTVDGLMVGTPEYMSPEQAAGDPVSEKSDVYSLGCLAYELLTGKPPITGATPGAVLRAHLHVEPASLQAQRSDLSPHFAALVMRCLNKDPDERPGAEEVTRALGAVRRASIEWPPPGLEALHRRGAHWLGTLGRFAVALALFVLILGIHPAAARPCCADSPDRSPGWLLLKRLSMVTPIHFDDPDALAIWYFLLDASFFVALAALVPFVISTFKLVGRVVAGRRNGYPVPVLARVAWDRHRDTRDLLNLTARHALVSPERQAGLIRRRAVASGMIGLSFVLLIATCLAWLGGLLQLTRASSSGLLPLTELLVVLVPAVAAWVVYLVLELTDLSHRWRPRAHGVRLQPLRQEVLEAWLATSGIKTGPDRWGILSIRALGLVGAALGGIALVVAAYGLIAVFGASARFAGDRAAADQWLLLYQDPTMADSGRAPLEPRAALALAASIPLEPALARLARQGRLAPGDGRLLIQSIGPGFCLNPREVLFGLAPERLRERDRVAQLSGVEPAAIGEEFDPGPLQGSGFAALRRRARYCERFIGQQATISTPYKPISRR